MSYSLLDWTAHYKYNLCIYGSIDDGNIEAKKLNKASEPSN